MTEQIILDNGILRVAICPGLGGKITSFYLMEKEFELAAQRSSRRNSGGVSAPDSRESFAAYAYGMDDAFPNIESEKIERNGKVFSYPDHGEIWKAAFGVETISPESVSLCWRSPAFHYRFQKRMRISKNTLEIQYYIINEGKEAFPCIWTWHGLVRYEQDMELLLPRDLTHYRNVFEGNVLGKEGQVYPLHNAVYDFSRMPDPKRCNCAKYYGETATKIGHCGVQYPSEKVVYSLDYDAGLLPYLGVWVTAGGFQGDYNCALEPTNGYYDSIGRAARNRKLPVLEQGEALDFTIRHTLRAL